MAPAVDGVHGLATLRDGLTACRPRLMVGDSTQAGSGSDPVVRKPRCFGAALWTGQFSALSLGEVGLLMKASYHAGFTR